MIIISKTDDKKVASIKVGIKKDYTTYYAYGDTKIIAIDNLKAVIKSNKQGKKLLIKEYSLYVKRLRKILKEMNNIDFTKVRYWRKNGNRN